MEKTVSFRLGYYHLDIATTTGCLRFAIVRLMMHLFGMSGNLRLTEIQDVDAFIAEPAHLAESLVNITSLKRKYSPDEESVSGPIDVAVISRSDGFVWVKRKHYFPPQLNGRFFARKYGRQLPDDGEQNGTEAPQ